MARELRWTRLRAQVLAVACLGLVLNLVLQPVRALRDFADTDFVNFLAAARIRNAGGCLYCPDAQHSATAAVLGLPHPVSGVRFVSPPLVAAAFQPLTRLQPRQALVLFLVVSLLAMAAAAWLIARFLLPSIESLPLRAAVVCVAVASMPASWGIALGQLDPILFLVVAAGLVLAPRWPVLGGALLGVLAVKPQLFLLVPVALLIGRNGRMLLGAAVTGALIVVSTVWMLGPSHALDWPRFVASQYGDVTSHSVSAAVHIGRLAGSTAVTNLTSGVLLALSVVALWLCRDLLRDGFAAVALALALTAVATVHLLPYDILLLALPLAFLARTHAARAIVAALLLSAAYAIDSSVSPEAAPVETLLVAVAMAMVLAGAAEHLRDRRSAPLVGPRPLDGVDGADLVPVRERGWRQP